MYKKLLTLIFIFFLFYVLTGKSYAVDCTSVPISGSYVIPAGGCTFANTVDGVDEGTGASNSAVLTVPSGRTLTLNANQTIAFGLINMGGDGVIAKSQSGAQLVKKPLWMQDCNANGTPGSVTQTASLSSPGTSYRRRNLLSSISSTDNSDSVDATYKYAWGENIGWLSLNCSNTGTCGTVNYQATKSGTTLAGYGWAEKAGWISFNCSNTGTCGTVNYGVSVDGSGYFSGYGWAENAGWISFNCSNTGTCGTVDYKVKICQ